MADIKIAQYKRWFAYEQDAHEKVLASFKSVPEERRSGADYRRAATILAHVVAARRIWLWRLGASGFAPSSLFPEDPDVERISQDWDATSLEWIQYLDTLDDAGVERVFEYKSIDGGRFRNSIEDVLAQLFGHSSYHRGQIAMLIRSAGGTPEITDLIYWCREPIANAEE